MAKRMQLKQYLAHRRALATTPFRIKPNGKAGYMVRGKMIPEQVFMEMHDTSDFNMNTIKNFTPLNQLQ